MQSTCKFESGQYFLCIHLSSFCSLSFSGWASKNSNNVGSRSVSTALYNSKYTSRNHPPLKHILNAKNNSIVSVQLGNIISNNIYRDNDKPLYKRGNRVLIGINVLSILLFLFAKFYYVARNKYRDRKWNAMSKEVRHPFQL
jgi:hypothetical protein